MKNLKTVKFYRWIQNDKSWLLFVIFVYILNKISKYQVFCNKKVI
jgi:hypothetical protein